MWRTVPGSELLSSWFTGSSQHGFSKGKSDLSNPLQWNDCQELRGEQHCLPTPLPLSQKMLGNDDGQSLPPARCRWHKLRVAVTPAAPAAIPRHLCRLEKWAVEEESCTLTQPGAIQLLKPLCREGPGLLEMDRRQQGAQTRLMAWAAPAGWQRWSFPFLTQEQCPGWHTQTQLKATKGFRDCSTSLTRKGWGSRDCLARRKLRETLIKHIPSSEGGCKHGARHSLEHVSFPLSPRTHSYWGWLRAAELPRDRVSFLGDPKPSGHHSGQQGLDGMAGAESMDLQRSLPTSTSLRFCELKKTMEVLKKWQSFLVFFLKKKAMNCIEVLLQSSQNVTQHSFTLGKSQ